MPQVLRAPPGRPGLCRPTRTRSPRVGISTIPIYIPGVLWYTYGVERNKPGAFRIVKVPLLVEKLDELDDVIHRGVGGFRDRQELISEAIDAYLLDLKYGSAEQNEREIQTPSGPGAEAPSALRPQKTDPSCLTALSDCVTIEGTAIEVPRAPLFGLHNRDFPSLWAAWQLAAMTTETAVSQSDFLKNVTLSAWNMGDVLRKLGGKLEGPKLEALFPTNRSKPDASEDAFKSFAIGTCSKSNGSIRCGGPLFLWNVCAVEQRKGELYFALTSIGKNLLERLDGLSALTPHSSNFADAFLGHLQEHAPDDWWGFTTVMKSAKENPVREELLQCFRRERDHLKINWTDHQIGSYATGYVSRCREWGILQPKLVNGRYCLTEYGSKLCATAVHTNV